MLITFLKFPFPFPFCFQIRDVKRRSEDQKRQAALELMAKKRRDEDEQDRLHRERVRKQLEADKKARQHRKAVAEGGVPAEGTSEAKPPVSAAATETTASAAATAPSPAASSSSGTARIKVTLLSGEIITETFQPTDPFQVILDFVAAHQSESPITLLQTFPRRRLTAADAATTLEALGFVPNIALTCAPVAGPRPPADSSRAEGVSGWLGWVGSALLPSTLFGSTPPAGPSPATSPPATDSAAPRPWGARVARLNNEAEDRDKETFNNGNTTEYKG
jgi:hypothetical protein